MTFKPCLSQVHSQCVKHMIVDHLITAGTLKCPTLAQKKKGFALADTGGVLAVIVTRFFSVLKHHLEVVVTFH